MAWSFRNWKTKQRGNPNMLVAAAIGFTITLYAGYKWAYAPWALKRKLREAEEYADFLDKAETKNELNQ